MANITFEQYFKNRAETVGSSPASGDLKLVLRGDTVFKSLDINSRAMAYMSGNSTATAITSVDAWTPIGGTLSTIHVAACWTFASNQFQYIGPTQATPVILTANASLYKTSVGVEGYEIGIMVNGVVIGTGIRASVASGEYAAVSCTVPYILSTGDVVKLVVRSKDGTNDITVTEAQLVIC